MHPLRTQRARRRIVPLVLAVVLPAGALPATAHAQVTTPAAHDPADQFPGLNLIPWPKALDVRPGSMELSAHSRIVTGDDRLRPLAGLLAGEIQLLTGLPLQVATGQPRAGDIGLALDRSITADQPILTARPPGFQRTTEGAHTVLIGEHAVVRGFDYRAVAEGSTTILQAIRQAHGRVILPRLAIKDWPHADYCGMMVDCGRQNQPVEWLRKMIETCRIYKVRYFHLHLTDDQGWTFPSAKYPQLGSKNHGTHGGAAPEVYTLDELRELVAFADTRGITLVPELELPGHSGAALRSLPEIFDAINPDTGQPVGMGCMNMASESIYPALDTIIGEMCEVFRSSPFFHIGSDEVSMGRVNLSPTYREFMSRHRLKNDGELANHFIAAVNEMVKKRGKITIKWEGLADSAATDIIVMTWSHNSNRASELVAQGRTTITCPWTLAVPWPEWNMYVCNASRLKPGDPVLGATLVAWEQSAEKHAAMVRMVAARQERTWGPDNSVTEAGFDARFQALDAVVGRLAGLPPNPTIEATATTTAGTRDLLDPVLAFDGDDATFHQSADPPRTGDQFTLTLARPALVHAVEVLTGNNGRGRCDGAELQVSADGAHFVTVATVAGGGAVAALDEHRVQAVRLRCPAPADEPMTIREIKLQRMVGLAGAVDNPGATIGAGNLGTLTADAAFKWPNDGCRNPVLVNGFTLTFDSGGGNPCRFDGPLTGTGTVAVLQGAADGNFRDSPLVLGGTEPNTMHGAWRVKAGRLTLAKQPGITAAAGTIVVGGQGDNDCLCWANPHQLDDAASVTLLDSPKGGATLDLNGCDDRFARLDLAPGCAISTDGPQSAGVLSLGELTVAGTRLPAGIYTAAEPWLRGGGFVVVGEIQQVPAAGTIDDANATIGPRNIAVLTAPTTFGPATGDCTIPVRAGGFDLTIRASGRRPAAWRGFITGAGGVTIEAAGPGSPADRQPLTLTGPAPNSYRGPTVLARGVLVLAKPAGAAAIPGDLRLGGSQPANAGDAVVLAADGQFAPTATITLDGKAQPCFLDLAGHASAAAKVLLDGQARIRTGRGGRLRVQQLVVDGQRIAAGTHRAPQPWLEGDGSVTIDPRVDIAGRYTGPNDQIGSGNIGNMTANTEFAVSVGNCDIDLLTNGHSITLDSGDGNPLCFLGSIAGTGNVVLLMGPSHTGFKDAPLRLAGTKPNTTTGTFFARKGRVQLEKQVGVDAISGNVVVGGQGFNDCLHWINSHQINDRATITLLDAGNNGAAYLSLNGCDEAAAALVMAAHTTVKTDNPAGQGGTLTVRSLEIAGARQPPGTYSAATAKWLEGSGMVVVAP